MAGIVPVTTQPSAGDGAGATVGGIVDCVNQAVQVCEEGIALLRDYAPPEFAVLLTPASKLQGMFGDLEKFKLNSFALPIPGAVEDIVSAVETASKLLAKVNKPCFEKCYGCIGKLMKCPCVPAPSLGKDGENLTKAAEIIDQVLELLQPAYDAAKMLMGGGMPGMPDVPSIPSIPGF